MIDDPKPEDTREGPAVGCVEPLMEAELKTEKGTARLGQDIQAKIGQQLRAMYAEVLDQGVPERFVDLLRRLDEERRDRGNG